MYTATITSKGQVTLPAEMRKDFGFKKADKIVFSRKNGDLIMKRLPSIDSLFGSLANPKIKPLTNIQMKKLIEEKMFSDDDIT